MRRAGWYLLSLLSLSALPLSAHALVIDFCVPDCASDPSKHTVASTPGQTSTNAAGVTTTTVPIANFVHQSFTIEATVKSQQSGTLQEIDFNLTTITANDDADCTTSAPNPCRIEIVATSEPCDFPTDKPAGGYPAGVFMTGFFTGPQAVGNGDTISMTGAASGTTPPSPALSPAACNNPDPRMRPAAQPVADADVINATPGTGPGNTGVSLPDWCTGSPTCKFIATRGTGSFWPQITETVQQVCANAAPNCLTQLTTRLNVEIKTAGNSVTLPLRHVTANPDPEPDPAKKKNPAKELTHNLAPPFEDLDVEHLAIGHNDFLLTAKVKLDAGNTIDPVKEEVYFRVGPFSMIIPPNKFKRLLHGKLFTFVGRVDGRDVAATFARSHLDPNDWKFIVGVHNVKLHDLPDLQPPLQVPVQLGVGSDTGKDVATAHFF